VGDSGEELGDVSVTDGESNVEMVVVGDESVDSDVIDETLCRCTKGRGPDGTSLGRSFTVCESFSDVNVSVLPSRPSRELDPAPNTDMKDGNETGSEGEFAGTGMLDRETDIDLRFDGIVLQGLLVSSAV
jgi:hypothetical protein